MYSGIGQKTLNVFKQLPQIRQHQIWLQVNAAGIIGSQTQGPPVTCKKGCLKTHSIGRIDIIEHVVADKKDR
jgi:hypothetical protein